MTAPFHGPTGPATASTADTPHAPLTLALLDMLDGMAIARCRVHFRVSRLPARGLRVQDPAARAADYWRRSDMRRWTARWYDGLRWAACRGAGLPWEAAAEFGRAAAAELAQLGRDEALAAVRPARDVITLLGSYSVSIRPDERDPPEGRSDGGPPNWVEQHAIAREVLLEALASVGVSVSSETTRRRWVAYTQGKCKGRTAVALVRGARKVFDGRDSPPVPIFEQVPVVGRPADWRDQAGAETPNHLEDDSSGLHLGGGPVPHSEMSGPERCAFAVSLLTLRPRLTIDQIADRVGVHRQRLHDSPVFEGFRTAAPAFGMMPPRAKRRTVRKGHKTAGRVEAYADSDD